MHISVSELRNAAWRILNWLFFKNPAQIINAWTGNLGLALTSVTLSHLGHSDTVTQIIIHKRSLSCYDGFTAAAHRVHPAAGVHLRTHLLPVKNPVVSSHQFSNEPAGLPLSAAWFGFYYTRKKKRMIFSLLIKLEMSGLGVWVNPDIF